MGNLRCRRKANSPAHKAGIRKGDIIIELGGQKVDSMAKMRQITTYGVGKSINIKFVRENRTFNRRVTLERID